MNAKEKAGTPPWQHSLSTTAAITPGTPMENEKSSTEVLTAVQDTLALAFIALCATMPPEQKQAFSANLAKAAKNAEQHGDLLVETLLLNLYRASTR